MSDLLTTLPGDIPGLLCDFSPLSRVYDPRRPGERGVVLSTPPRTSYCIVKWQFDSVTELLGELTAAYRLDLTDPTGRVHAAWFIRDLAERDGEVWLTLTVADWSLIGVAEAGRNMTPTQIDTLARLVLRLAGRTS